MSTIAGRYTQFLQNLKARLLDNADNGLGLRSVQITHVDTPAPAYPAAYIWPQDLDSDERNMRMPLSLVIHVQLAISESAVLELYSLAERTLAYLESRQHRLGASLERRYRVGIGERTLPDGNGQNSYLPPNSYIVIELTGVCNL